MSLFPRNPSDKRKHYRVLAGQDLQVSLLVGEDWRTVPLIDVTSGGAALLVDPASGAPAEQGQELALRFNLRGRDRAIECMGIIRRVEQAESEGPESVRLGVQFLDTEALYEQFDESLWGYFNRRGSLRVPIERDQPETRVTWPGKRLDGAVQDLGIMGCAVAFPRDTLLLLLPGTQVRLEFIVPGMTRAGMFGAGVIHRYARRERLVVGFEFRPTRSPSFTKNQEAIREHVMGRQRAVRQDRGR